LRSNGLLSEVAKKETHRDRTEEKKRRAIKGGRAWETKGFKPRNGLKTEGFKYAKKSKLLEQLKLFTGEEKKKKIEHSPSQRRKLHHGRSYPKKDDSFYRKLGGTRRKEGAAEESLEKEKRGGKWGEPERELNYTFFWTQEGTWGPHGKRLLQKKGGKKNARRGR